MNRKLILLTLFICLVLNAAQASAQTTSFTYQGKLADNNGNPLSGNYDFQFSLFDDPSAGMQVGTTQTAGNILVTNGIFAVTLDFVNCSGCSCPTCFNGSPRFLAIAVKPTSGGSYTPLAPRQPVTSNPYAIKSLNAAAADGLSVACLNCVTSGQIQSVNGSAVGTIPVASVPAGSASYIQNTTSQQAASNFSISGNGIIGGKLGVGSAAPGYKLEVIDPASNGLRVQTDGSGGAVASFGGNGAFFVDGPGTIGGRFTVLENGNSGFGTTPAAKLHIAVNSGQILLGDAGCSPGFNGISFASSFGGCANYSLLGNGTDTIINRPTGGAIFFR